MFSCDKAFNHAKNPAPMTKQHCLACGLAKTCVFFDVCVHLKTQMFECLTMKFRLANGATSPAL